MNKDLFKLIDCILAEERFLDSKTNLNDEDSRIYTHTQSFIEILKKRIGIDEETLN